MYQSHSGYLMKHWGELADNRCSINIPMASIQLSHNWKKPTTSYRITPETPTTVHLVSPHELILSLMITMHCQTTLHKRLVLQKQ